MDSKLTTATLETTAVQIATLAEVPEQSLSATFRYDPADPWAITMTVESSEGPVVWTFARELLVEGQYEPTGDGDVHIWPCLSPSGEAVVIIELDAPDGESLLQFPGRDVRSFVGRSLELVPAGTESVDVDAWLTHLLAA